jgi:hypothetical protein
MSTSQIQEKLDEGLSDIENGSVRLAMEAFELFRKAHSNESVVYRVEKLEECNRNIFE